MFPVGKQARNKFPMIFHFLRNFLKAFASVNFAREFPEKGM
jgi:hypothetical protein